MKSWFLRPLTKLTSPNELEWLVEEDNEILAFTFLNFESACQYFFVQAQRNFSNSFMGSTQNG